MKRFRNILFVSQGALGETGIYDPASLRPRGEIW